jgi:hypothetical protein
MRKELSPREGEMSRIVASDPITFICSHSSHRAELLWAYFLTSCDMCHYLNKAI